MILLPPELRFALRANDIGRRAREAKGEPFDPVPVLKLFNPLGAATWLATELAEDDDTLFGLADLGFGCPELGSFSLSEIASVRLPFGLGIERDLAGLPVIEVPAEWLSPNATPDQKAMVSALRDLVQNIRRNEQDGVIIPSETRPGPDGTQVPSGFKLRLLNSGGSRQINPGDAIKRHQTNIAMTLLADFLRDEAGDVFRWEQFRAYALFHGLPHPPSPNAWGSLPRIAAKRGLIVATVRYEAARSERTRAHPVMLWRAA